VGALSLAVVEAFLLEESSLLEPLYATIGTGTVAPDIDG
jgi:hypothetical protein